MHLKAAAIVFLLQVLYKVNLPSACVLTAFLPADMAFKLDEARTRLASVDKEIQKFQDSFGLSLVPSDGEG